MITLYNSLSRTKEAFVPRDEKRITMYVCGPTVYNYAHIGNGRSAVTFDVLYRVLRHAYSAENVVYARNITDIDDKINASAKEQGIDISVITDKFTKIYQDDLKALGNLSPDLQPTATGSMDEIISMCERLIAAGHAYVADNHVLFDVPSYEEYGQLSRADQDQVLAGARVDVASYKKDPSDFVLWKPSTDDMPGWESPWGRGRPGWHIECSAMIAKHLGKTIDIHCGGNDLIFPHHENEIAQSRCSHGGQEFVRYWMHNGMLTMGDEKMSKSLGNILLINEIINECPPEAVRMSILSAHYRKPLVWSENLINQSLNSLDTFYKKLRSLKNVEAEPKAHDSVIKALYDDINTPQAYAALFGLLKDQSLDDAALKSALLGSGALMGLLQDDPDTWLADREETRASNATIGEDEILTLITNRKNAKANKDYALSDKIRDDLLSKGVALEDTADGTIWHFV